MAGVRYDRDLSMRDMYPGKGNGLCALCAKALPPRRRRWCSEACSSAAVREYLIRKGHTATVRYALLLRDNGKCAQCGRTGVKWEAHHIIAISEGGGKVGLDGFQTLCVACHREETIKLRERLRRKSQQIFQTPALPLAEASP